MEELNGKKRWVIQDCLLRNPNDPVLLVSDSIKFIIEHLDGLHTFEQITRIVNSRFKGNISENQVRRLVEELDKMLFLKNEKFLLKYNFLKKEIEERETYDHNWLNLYKKPELIEQAINSISLDQDSHHTILVPHAEHEISYSMAAQGIAMLRKQLEEDSTLIIIGPNHVTPKVAGVFLGNKNFRTPAGDVEVDKRNIEGLKNLNPSIFKINNIIHQREHSIALQIPFIRTLLPNHTKVIPIVISFGEGDNWLEIIKDISYYIKNFFKEKKIRILISGDLFHYSSLWIQNLGDREDKEMLLNSTQYIYNWDNNALEELSKGDLQAFTKLGFLGRYCATAPIWLSWEILNLRRAGIISYSHIGDFIKDGNGVSCALSYFE